MSTTTRPTTGRIRLSRPAAITSWVFQLAGASLFLNFGSGKVTGSNASAIDTFNEIGLGDNGRVAIGTLEILGAIGLLIPLFTALAAVCLAALAIGALGITLFITGGSPIALILCLIIVATVAVIRHRAITAPFTLARRLLFARNRAVPDVAKR